MTIPLRIASIAFVLALCVAVTSGLWLIWSDSEGSSQILWRILGSSILVILASGLFISVRDAMNRMKSAQSSPPTNVENK